LAKKQQYYVKEAIPEEELLAIAETSKEMSPSKIEETSKELNERLAKAQKEVPPPPPTTIAWADSFDSQGSYLFASAFDQVYLQPSGEVPLTGVAMQIPFVKRALDWLGVEVYAEARREFKSMISTFTESDGLPPAQLEDEARLLGELSRSLAHAIGVNRFPKMDPTDAADLVSEMSKRGPFSAKDAVKEGLITGVKYKSEVLKELGEDPKLKSLASYSRINDRALERQLSDDERADVAVIYLRGTISNAPGDFSASSAIKGLREAGEDENISSIVLRIDSGGGDVVASDSIWDAVRRVQETHKKPVVASYGNVSASGGYYASAGADAIMACESTITGSIGVASLKPTFTKKFFDRVGVAFQTLFTGSNTNSSFHDLTPEEKEKYSLHIDETYDTFLEKVCTGRKSWQEEGFGLD
jgi:signal peptide peptidase SppA